MLMDVIVQVQVQLRISYCVLFSESEPQQVYIVDRFLEKIIEEETNVKVVITNAMTHF